MLIGQGGTATIYEALDLQLERYVALKVRRKDTTDYVSALKKEAYHMLLLNHPNVLKCYQYDQWRGVEYLVLERIRGKDARQKMKESPDGQLGVHDAASIGIQILQALSHIHQEGVVHGDVKPRNILIDTYGDATLCDFGASQTTKEGAGEKLICTAGYVSPERLRGHGSDIRSDLYSLGMTIFSLANGAPAFGRDPEQAIEGNLNKRPPLRSALPPPLHKVVRKSLAKSPHDRYQTAKQMEAAVVRALDRIRVRQRLSPLQLL